MRMSRSAQDQARGGPADLNRLHTTFFVPFLPAVLVHLVCLALASFFRRAVMIPIALDLPLAAELIAVQPVPEPVLPPEPVFEPEPIPEPVPLPPPVPVADTLPPEPAPVTPPVSALLAPAPSLEKSSPKATAPRARPTPSTPRAPAQKLTPSPPRAHLATPLPGDRLKTAEGGTGDPSLAGQTQEMPHPSSASGGLGAGQLSAHGDVPVATGSGSGAHGGPGQEGPGAGSPRVGSSAPRGISIWISLPLRPCSAGTLSRRAVLANRSPYG